MAHLKIKIDTALQSVFGIPFDEKLCKSREQPFIDVRHALHYSLVQVMDKANARFITNTNRTTFVCSIQSCEDRLFVDSIYKRQVEKLTSELKKIYEPN